MKLFLLYLPLWGSVVMKSMSLLKGKPNPNQNESRIVGDGFFLEGAGW